MSTMLSSEQKQAVEHRSGPLLVIAPPGTGKTHVITERIRYLLAHDPKRFRVLVLTISKLAAENITRRLADLNDQREQVSIETINKFCQELLAERGKHLGIDGRPKILWQAKDRREVLLRAIYDDPILSWEIDQFDSSNERDKKIDGWLSSISYIKSHPLSCAVIDNEYDQRIFDAYTASMQAYNVFDPDDLPLLAYKLLTEHEKLANLYRRLYPFICIDEAHDLSEAQYALIRALCLDGSHNVMMVGDPQQSIFRIRSSSPEYMERFGKEFNAKILELTSNYRLSRAVVTAARALEPNYMVSTKLPLEGSVTFFEAKDENEEANLIADELQNLCKNGHSMIEGPINPAQCAILGRNRFSLLAIEEILQKRGVPYRKNIATSRDRLSEISEDFLLALHIISNPKDSLPIVALARRWKTKEPGSSEDGLTILERMVLMAENIHAPIILQSAEIASRSNANMSLLAALQLIQNYADSLDEGLRLATYEDVAVLKEELRQYVNSAENQFSLSSFLSRRSTKNFYRTKTESVALLTVHSAQGLEFDVVFIPGMVEGVFPDFRARTEKELEYEKRLIFVAVTRARRLLYFTYAKKRAMPWGEVRSQHKSRFLKQVQNYL